MFTPEEFTATRFATVADKARFANQFVRFVRRGFTRADFPEWFYRRLAGTFGHIAHCNRGGFYETFFLTTSDRLRFLHLTIQYACYGKPTVTWSDVERALQSWITREGVVQELVTLRQVEVEVAEREVAARLLAKYPDLLLRDAA